MKRKILLLLALSIVNQFYLAGSSGAGPFFGEKIDSKKQQLLEETRAATGVPASSTGVAITGINYNQIAFVPHFTMRLPIMYLGAASDFVGAAQPFSFARGFVDSTGKVHVSQLADKASVNGADETTSPLLGKTITNLSLMGGDPRFGSIPVLTTNDPEKVYLVTNPDPGMVRILSNETGAIADAAGAVIANDNIVAVAASPQCIFAAVPQAGAMFGDDGANDRGIALLTRDVNHLKVHDATNFAGTTAQAQKLDVAAAAELISFVDMTGSSTIDRALLGDDVDMVYDPILNRVYVGLSDVKRAGIANEGGVLGVVVGRVEQDKFVLSPIVNGVTKGVFYDATNKNALDQIIGFYFDGVMADGGDLDARVSITHPRVMHTSTGKNYLIVNSKIDNTVDIKQGVFALPLIPNEAGIDASLVGTIGSVDGDGIAKFDNTAPASFNDIPNFDEGPARVDAPLPECSPEIEHLRDIYIEGDSVFLAYAGDAKSESAGIYRATALFNADGAIRAWTQLTRVSGDARRTQGIGVDNRTGNLHFVTPATQDGADTDFNTLRVTQWGKSDDVAKVADTETPNNLTSLLNEIFPEEICRVHQICAFDEFTPGFKTCEFSMMVALGKNTVALIQTGKIVGGNFLPVQQFETSGANQNVFVFKGGVLDEIGPLSCCELSRIDSTNNKGWLFVGGYRGVAVLSAADGTGFDSGTTGGNGLDNLTAAGFPGNGFTFKKLLPSNNPENAFSNVRSLQMGGGNLVAETQKSIFSIAPTADKFKTTASDDLNETSIAGIPALSSECFSDLVFLANTNETLIVGTTAGLFAATGNGSEWVEITVNNQSIGPVVQLQYLSQTKGVNSQIGNLYVLAGTISTSMGKVYRFYVDGTQAALVDRVKPIKNPDGSESELFNLGEFRGNLITDGADLFHSLSKHLGQTRFLEARPIANLGLRSDITPLLNVNTSCEITMGAMIQEPAFGTWIVPGDWGVRVNQ